MSTLAPAAAEPPEEDLGRLAEGLRALHAGREVAVPVPSPAARRLTAAHRIGHRIRSAQEAVHDAGREELEAALAQIVGRAPRTLPPRVHRPRRSLWDPTLEIDPYWSPTPILGFRAWGLGSRLEGARRPWTTPTYEAGCVSRGTERFDGAVPHTDGSCGKPPCGIYATKAPKPLLDEFGGYRMAYGVVALSGKVVEHDHGYRAQRATAVFVAVEHESILITIEGEEDLRLLFADPLGYLAPDRARPRPVHRHPEIVMIGALQSAAERLGRSAAGTRQDGVIPGSA